MRWALACALLSGCDEAERAPGAPRDSAQYPDLTARLPPARRPPERYVMERNGERCLVRIQRPGEADAVIGDDYPCQRDLQLGERIVLTGRTCLRESPEATRATQIVCPDYLTNAEREVESARTKSSASP